MVGREGTRLYMQHVRLHRFCIWSYCTQTLCITSHVTVCVHLPADVTMEHHGGTAQDPLLPLLLILGFASGYSVWMVPVSVRVM